ncbi:hypothetical protein COT65_01570 [Candidatus Shapirobacteria bacterium CG09_land_8_20_14_0_10_47_13]|uniref:Uncharacterized protein n=1 Tax=Candidatus Shapirobacteria bacterium CG09_land_8_20_14_0_10_47_13 TaxID=1974481 RepID=A0A2H0WMN2_9BACT|nr:MAG: hypothetical protein COT65_01570 [Candidatus Shapirobacteria bacterium CG09_land_8_20_14_0_10_47_13]
MQRQKLIKRAQLIVGLPARVRETMARGQSFPEDNLNDLEILSDRAKKALEGVGHGHRFALIAFLTPSGQLEGQPDLLEEIIK